MSVTIWHNPRCSKSRAALALLQDRGIEPEIRLYLQDTPTKDELITALGALGKAPHDLIRTGEAAYKEAGLGPNDPPDKLLEAMVAHPKLIERAIVFVDDKARVGRPPEAILEIL